VDLRAATGTPVLAYADGVAQESQSTNGGTGLVINQDDGEASYYAHLSKRLVKTGDRVKCGQEIALSGNTGISTGPHLHFELRRNGVAYNPAAALLETAGVIGGTPTPGEILTGGASLARDALGAVVPWAEGLASLLATLVDPTFWKRVGIGTAGAVLVVAGVGYVAYVNTPRGKLELVGSAP
jgi:murein DD-endopeptidase MepM/ murein hydrolase activator NlpD